MQKQNLEFMLEHQQDSWDLSTPKKIKDTLHKALESLGKFNQCALLDYPDYLNIGDHLIWLGTVFYLKDVLKTKINYTATVTSFSGSEMEKKIGDSPIIFQGGGNMGDLWPELQKFREKVIARYQNQPIIILPQTIQFANPDNLKQAADVFNSHPNLTIFAREHTSYEIASEYFSNCHVIKCPDMAFHLVNMPGLSLNPIRNSSILYHCRSDYKNFSKDTTGLDLVKEDWVSYTWIYRENLTNPKAWYWKIPGIVRLIREGWQRRLANPSEWISRQLWRNLHPYTAHFADLDNPSLGYNSWSLMHSGIYQLQQYPIIVTNRMHGHVLCIILGIPHVFLPGSYHKNKSFYTTWTYQLPFCRFVEQASEVKGAVEDLLYRYAN